MSKPNAKMRSVAKDIIQFKPKPEMTLKQLQKAFYDIMRKHGIKKMTKYKGGMQGNNFEWTICSTMFKDQLLRELTWMMLFDKLPKDLECY